jgi:ketosteroid isomerase-like protein
MPPIVEAHLTALHDHDPAAVDAILAPDILVAEVPFPQANRRGQAAAAGWHADLFATWTDFRFMPRHWHNLGGAAFLEGEASFIHRGERHGIRAEGKPVTLDMLFVYHLSEAGIDRLKLYYDAGSLLRQLAAPGVQGELF